MWQPIETAPRDGKVIDLWRENEHGGERLANCFWQEADEYCEAGWCQQYAEATFSWFSISDDDTGLTHWMPLPAPPDLTHQVNSPVG